MLFALSQAPRVFAETPEGSAPPTRLEDANRQTVESSQRGGQERADRRLEQKSSNKKNKRQQFQEKHKRYDTVYEIPENHQLREPGTPRNRYEEFQVKRERYRQKQKPYRIDRSVEDVKSLIEKLELGDDEGTRRSNR